MSLEARLKALIAQAGPMTAVQYMTACLHDPQDGYYATRPRLGAGGDFITAPLVSQMFGELIGLWAAETWDRMGRPPVVRLVEMGPGDGTLIGDMLRAAKLVPDFVAAIDLWLVEVSAPMIVAQVERLSGGPATPNLAAALSEIPGGAPIILVANELLDCLPAHQYVRTPSGWAERMVGLDERGELAFGLGAQVPPPEGLEAEPGQVFELSPAQAAMGAEIGARLARDGGVALLIDYGRAAPGLGDTLQALRGHARADPLTAPGTADLTVHVDFPAVLAAARAAGSETGPLLTQAALLGRLGLETRAQALAGAWPDKADTLARQVERLVSPAEMGTLFKAACIHAPGLVPPAFEEPL